MDLPDQGMAKSFNALPSRMLPVEQLKDLEDHAEIEEVWPVSVVQEGLLASTFVLARSSTLHVLGFDTVENEWVVIDNFERGKPRAAKTAAEEWLADTYEADDEHEISEIEVRP